MGRRSGIRRRGAPPGDGRAVAGSERQVLDLVALVEAAPFDPGRSPWDVTVVEGLENGRAALYLRADHVLTDGMGGRELVMVLLDDLVEADEPPSAPSDSRSLRDGSTRRRPDSQRRPGTVTLTVDLTTVARPVAAGIAAARCRSILSTRWCAACSAASTWSARCRASSWSPGVRCRRSYPSGSLATRFETLSVPGARTAAIRLGGSRNVLLVAAAADGLGAYHERARATGGRTAAGDAHRFCVTTAPPAATPSRRCAWRCRPRADQPGPHFGVVADRLAQGPSRAGKQLTRTLSTAISMLPPRALLPAVHAQLRTVDFIATALRGLRGLGTICGAVDRGQLPVRASRRPPGQRHRARQRGSARSRPLDRSRRRRGTRRPRRVPRGGVRAVRRADGEPAAGR